MNALLAFVPKPVLFGLLIAALIVSTLQSCRVDKLKTENALFEVAVEQCAKTNANNVTKFTELQMKNNACVEGRQADETQHASAVAAWNVDREKLKVLANEKQTEIVEVFREPDCAELAQLNINNICPAFVSGLRQRAESLNGN